MSRRLRAVVVVATLVGAGAVGESPRVAADPPELDLGAIARRAASAEPDARSEAVDAARGVADVRALDVVVAAAAAAQRARDGAATELDRDGEVLARLYDDRERETAAFDRHANADPTSLLRFRRRMDGLRERIDALEGSTSVASREVAMREEELATITRATASILARLPDAEVARGLARLAAAWVGPPSARSDDRLRFVDAIEHRKHAAVAAALVALVRDGKADPRVRGVALDACAARRDDGALADAIALLGDASWVVRAAAIDVLRTLHDPSAIEPLIAFLGRDDLGRLREDACRALRSLTGEGHGPYREPWAAWWADVRATFEPPRRPTALAALIAPPTGVTYYGISTFSERVVFVSDVSGSMAERDGGKGRPATERKIDAARRELFGALDGLDERRARFGVVLFDRGVRRWSGGLVTADRASRAAAKAWIAAREPAGETNLYGALREALRLAGGADTVFLLTDGRPTAGGLQSAERIVDALQRWNRAARVTVHCVGIGTSPDEALLRSLAAVTGGRYVKR